MENFVLETESLERSLRKNRQILAAEQAERAERAARRKRAERAAVRIKQAYHCLFWFVCSFSAVYIVYILLQAAYLAVRQF